MNIVLFKGTVHPQIQKLISIHLDVLEFWRFWPYRCVELDGTRLVVPKTTFEKLISNVSFQKS